MNLLSRPIRFVVALCLSGSMLGLSAVQAGSMLNLPVLSGADVKGGYDRNSGSLSLAGGAVSVIGVTGFNESFYSGGRNPYDRLASKPFLQFLMESQMSSARFTINATVDSSQEVSGTFDVFGTKGSSEREVPLLSGSLKEVELVFGGVDEDGKRDIRLIIQAEVAAQKASSSQGGGRLLLMIGARGIGGIAGLSGGMGDFLNSFQIEDGTANSANAVPEPASGVFWAASLLFAFIPRRRCETRAA